MRVRLTLDVNDYQRFVVAKYFQPAGSGADKTRLRATRKQIRRFIEAAFRTAVQEQARELPSPRSRAAAERLKLPRGHREQETLPPPKEQQRSIPWM